MPMPTNPLETEEIMDTLVCVLKSIPLTNMVRGMIPNALTIRISPITLNTSIKTGSLKNRLIAGAATYKRMYKTILTIKLNKKTVL